MANLEIASVCNLGCPYCFAQKYMGDSEMHVKGNFISIADYQKHLDFLDRSNIGQVRLIGGEPTLHPDFPLLIQLAQERKKKIAVFSNGLMPQKALQSLSAIHPNDCIVLINTTTTKKNGEFHLREKQHRLSVIRTLGERALLGSTIYTMDFDMSEQLSLINKLGCRKAIRVGLAHPVSVNYESSIHPKQYWFIGQKLFEFAQKAHQLGVQLEFDCGFVRCMFTEEQVKILKSYNTSLGWNCSPVLDIHISGAIIMCFPNDGLADVQISSSLEAKQVRDEMIAKTAIYRNVGIFPECSECNFKRNRLCSGGGLEHIIKRFRHSQFQINVLI